MNDKFDIKARLGLVSSNSAPELPLDTELDDESEGRCYGWLRGVRDRALFLELRRAKEGDSVALPYSWLGPTRFHPSHGILLVFSAGELFGVRIRGRNLDVEHESGKSLFDRIIRQRITFIREMQESESRAAGEKECVVDRIEIESLTPNTVMQFLKLG
jgi:hypothetical protein